MLGALRIVGTRRIDAPADAGAGADYRRPACRHVRRLPARAWAARRMRLPATTGTTVRRVVLRCQCRRVERALRRLDPQPDPRADVSGPRPVRPAAHAGRTSALPPD